MISMLLYIMNMRARQLSPRRPAAPRSLFRMSAGGTPVQDRLP